MMYQEDNVEIVIRSISDNMPWQYIVSMENLEHNEQVLREDGFRLGIVSIAIRMWKRGSIE